MKVRGFTLLKPVAEPVHVNCDLIAASVASFTVWLVGAKRSVALQDKNYENEKMRPMPWEAGLRRPLSQYLEWSLVGSSAILLYSM
jgi:hypothetical protein